jgi:hypothetical protein
LQSPLFLLQILSRAAFFTSQHRFLSKVIFFEGESRETFFHLIRNRLFLNHKKFLSFPIRSVFPEARLHPHEPESKIIQEVLLFHRRFILIFILIMIGISVTSHFIQKTDCHVMASLA